MNLASFADRLVAWQRQAGRHDLPWQGSSDAYRVWLSEIMLQQTQVATVIPYYARFLERFPTLAALAAAPLESVLELWAGLGYYARARNLHRCAQVVVAEHDGRFPRDVSAIAELPGIGRSTAAAIAVFAGGARAAILDGNVKRVLARCYAVAGPPGSAATDKVLWQLAEQLLPERDLPAYTQGLMDLGATVCTRTVPACTVCPMQGLCIARRDGRQAELPQAKVRKTAVERATTWLLFSDGQRVLLERRPPAGIWGGLLSLPEADADGGQQGDAAAAAALARRHGLQLLGMRPLGELRHAFTHFRLRIRAVCCAVKPASLTLQEPGWQWLNLADASSAALPTPVRQVLERLAADPGGA